MNPLITCKTNTKTFLIFFSTKRSLRFVCDYPSVSYLFDLFVRQRPVNLASPVVGGQGVSYITDARECGDMALV